MQIYNQFSIIIKPKISLLSCFWRQIEYITGMKFMMISDYDAPLGGIEQYIRDAKKLLESDWHECRIVWLQWSQSQLNRRRWLLMWKTAGNIISALQIVYHIITYQPDVIWWHSVSRYIGRLPMRVSGIRNTRQRIMYHDLWYVHPYPSTVTDVSQIPHTRDLHSWLAAGRTVGKTSFINTVMMTLKFWSNSMIRRVVLRNIDKHLVPSEFMIPIMVQWWVSISKIKVLGHFGRIE